MFSKTIINFLEEQYDTVNAKSISTAAHGFGNTDNNFIKMNMKPYKYTILQYLTLREISLFGFTCNSLYNEIFEFEVSEITRSMFMCLFKKPQPKITLRKFCTVDMPAHVIPHVTIL